MVRCWYMDDRQEDPQDDHLLEEVDTATVCERSGVEVWYFHPDQIQPGNESTSLLKLKQDRGYTYEDEIKVNPSMEKYEDKLKIFFSEHLHSDEEIRLVLDGSGFFDVRDRDDKWIRIHVFPGDLIILPAGMYHRFTPDKQNFIRARRFFVGEPIWTPINRPVGDTHPSRKNYVEHLYPNDAIVNGKNAIEAI
jgi:1,2-dihydroxy-3-keto-5-methylthiopentene dioxygenase